MSIVADILRLKDKGVVCVAPGATVLAATKLMNQHRIGSVVVREGEGRVVGMLTERDLLTRVLAAEKDPRHTLVSDVMTRDVVYCAPHTPLAHLRQTVRERRIRHIPVRDEAGMLLGLVSIGDLNAFESAEMSVTLHSLEEFITRS